MRKNRRPSQRNIKLMHIKEEFKKIHKLTEAQIEKIREMYDSNNYTLKEIADEVHCSISSVWYHALSPDLKKRLIEKKNKVSRKWQKRPGYERDKTKRYIEMYEKGMLEEKC